MHVHIAGLNADPAWSKQVLLPLLLANGVTGVRDMGGDLDTLLAWKREIEGGTLLGPHIVACRTIPRGQREQDRGTISGRQCGRGAGRGSRSEAPWRGVHQDHFAAFEGGLFCGCGRSEKSKTYRSRGTCHFR